MFSAVASLLLRCPVKRDVAMTGEITLRGNVLPVGGIKRRSSSPPTAPASRRSSLPFRNEADLDDVPKDIRAALKLHLIKRVDEVLALVLEPPIAPPPVPTAPDGEHEVQL